MFPGAVFSTLGAVIRNVKAGLLFFCYCLGTATSHLSHGGNAPASSV